MYNENNDSKKNDNSKEDKNGVEWRLRPRSKVLLLRGIHSDK